jgi:hypothetical protein
MPIYTPYPGPGAGISTAGLNKNAGWGSPGANAIGEAGINKTVGKSLSGLDQASNPIITSATITPGAAGTATIAWTTQVAKPLGSVQYRKASGGAWTTVAETGTPPLTTHSVALSGLSLSTIYEYIITQPGSGTGAKTGKQVYQGRFTTLVSLADEGTGGMGMLPGGESQTPPLMGGQDGQATPPAFGLSNLQANNMGATEMTVTWRTEVYADGTVMYRPVGGTATTVDELGVKRLNHSVTLTGLEPATQYEVAVISADAQGNTAEGGPISATTLPA